MTHHRPLLSSGAALGGGGGRKPIKFEGYGKNPNGNVCSRAWFLFAGWRFLPDRIMGAEARGEETRRQRYIRDIDNRG